MPEWLADNQCCGCLSLSLNDELPCGWDRCQATHALLLRWASGRPKQKRHKCKQERKHSSTTFHNQTFQPVTNHHFNILFLLLENEFFNASKVRAASFHSSILWTTTVAFPASPTAPHHTATSSFLSATHAPADTPGCWLSL
jgi:hypothetical protein